MLSDREWAQFERDGYLMLGQVVSDAELEALGQRMDEIMLGRVRYEGMMFQLDSETGVYRDVPTGGEWAGPTLNYRRIDQLEKDPLFLRYIQHPAFREITRRVYGENVAIYRAMFMNKPAHRGTVLPYHQDGGAGWALSLDPVVAVWTALDDALPENGCMQVIPGSHRLGVLSEHGHTLTPEREAQYCREEVSVYLEAPAGTAILLHNWLLHRSGVNPTGRSRRAFSVCYLDGATRYLRNLDQRFPMVFGEGALRPESVAVQAAGNGGTN
jgi:ectoine hydroxylase-related dioxygenase (phytanoyl-CoA dioxygenase family)